MPCAECPENTRMENCPECKRLFCMDSDHLICNECKQGVKYVKGVCYIVNIKRWNKAHPEAKIDENNLNSNNSLKQ